MHTSSLQQPIITQKEESILTYNEHEVYHEKPGYYDSHEYEYAEDIEFYWLQTCEDLENLLTDIAKKVSPQSYSSYWHIEGRNMGWLHRLGDRYVELPYGDMGAEMIRSFAPHGDYSFNLSRGTWQDREDQPAREILVVNCSHHDAPRGGEMLYLIPLTLQEWDRANGEENGEEE